MSLGEIGAQELDYMRGLGWPIIESEHMVEPFTQKIKRTWQERLFSLPWRPWQRVRFVTIFVPDENVYVFDVNGRPSICCHPSIAAQLRERLKEIS